MIKGIQTGGVNVPETTTATKASSFNVYIFCLVPPCCLVQANFVALPLRSILNQNNFFKSQLQHL